MTLFIEILDGALKGTRTPVREGLTIGRSGCVLTIRDSKLSSKHGKVEVRGENDFWLVDLGSANGIKYADSRVRELNLTPGLEFILGRTLFRVISADQGSASPELSSETVTRNPVDLLATFLDRARKAAVEKPKDLVAFAPALHLKFVGGTQLGEEWFIGYGPRTVGSGSFDLRILDRSVPDVCFRLIPDRGGVILKDETHGHLLVNGQSAISSYIKTGDRIRIASHEIEVL